MLFFPPSVIYALLAPGTLALGFVFPTDTLLLAVIVTDGIYRGDFGSGRLVTFNAATITTLSSAANSAP